MATRYVPGATSIEIPLRDTDEVCLHLFPIDARHSYVHTCNMMYVRVYEVQPFNSSVWWWSPIVVH